MKIKYLLVLVCLFMVACEKPVTKKDNAGPPEPPPLTNLHAEEFEALKGKFDAAMKEFQTAYSAAGTREEKGEVYRDKYPKAADYAPDFMALAKDHPQDEVAPKSLLWIVGNARGDESASAAVDSLLSNYADNEDLDTICSSLRYGGMNQKTIGQLELLREKSPHDKVKAAATFNLASFYTRLKSTKAAIADNEQMKKFYEKSIDFINDFEFNSMEVESLYQTVCDKYGDLKPRKNRPQTYKDLATAALFELNNLQIGKVAPDIEGEDLDGTEFKLSDYRGKVVILDFWGDW